MSRHRCTLVLASLLAVLPAPAWAGFTETLPQGMFLFDVGYSRSALSEAWDNDGDRASLVDEIVRYEPGGGRQGTLVPDATVVYDLMVFQLQYGVLDALSVGVGLPLVLRTAITPSFGWIPGDYQPALGRAYSQDDFWQWAASMGQSKPGSWSGNRGVPGDVVLGARLRFSDWIPGLRGSEWSLALQVLGALPTGRQADPEEVITAGTTMWDLHAQGDVGLHLGVDRTFRQALDDRLRLGVEVFYEALLPHRYTTPTGILNPLLLHLSPYVGKTYVIDPGDFLGGSFQVDGVPWRGPALPTWLCGHDPARAEALPPLLTLSVRYTFTGLLQSDWQSGSDLWDFTQEQRWRPGYKNVLTGTLLASLLRVGVPLQLYVSYRSLGLLPGRNTRAADVLTVGVRVPAKLW